MSGPLKIRFFVHSLVSDWNHGNAHFLRGLVRALSQMGHDVRSYEELGSWSLQNLVNVEGERSIEAIDEFRRSYPELDIRFYKRDRTLTPLLEEELKDADLVIIHEWNEPELVNAVLALKQRFGFKALFHDTHHRAYTRAGEILRFRLDLFDGVLAFGEAIRKIYRDGFGMKRAWTFHEAADVTQFKPIPEQPKQFDVLWIGNWGDEERTRELQEFLIGPAAELQGRSVVVHGVRYPEAAQKMLEDAGVDYRGYLPNLQAPRAYAAGKVSIHVPRRQYTNGLSGIPTIRMFEAMACGAPLLCAPWHDAENLFRPGTDFLCVPNGETMRAELELMLEDERARQQLGSNGRETVLKRHTCTHRAEELMGIYEEIAA
jgi:spore maturation protein CgeB